MQSGNWAQLIFSDKLSTLVLNMFNESLAQGTLPQTLTMDQLSVIVKTQEGRR